MIDPRAGARAAPTSPPRHGTSVRRGPHRRSFPGGGRFSRATLALATVAATAAGVSAGAVLDRPVTSNVQGVVDARQDVRLAAVPDEPVAAPVEDITAGALDRTAERQELPPEPAPVAVAAVPASIDPLLVDAAGLTFADRQAGLLSTAVPTSASGDLLVVPGSSPPPSGDRPVQTVRVEVEAGLEVDGELFAQMVMATLNDPRGWGADGSLTFARTDGDADIRVVLASPELVDDLCAPLDTGGRYSCGRNGRAALNHTRWVQATTEFTDRTRYRQYLVNHEVGHLLGHPHEECPAAGAVAPLMQQQSISVTPCVPNGWPSPDAR